MGGGGEEDSNDDGEWDSLDFKAIKKNHFKYIKHIHAIFNCMYKLDNNVYLASQIILPT